MAQAAVNQRITKGTGTTPFMALFGRAPTTLAAIEQPSLLPENTPEQRDVKSLAVAMARLHERIQKASDDVKAAARAAEKASTRPPRRQILPGDKLWLVYSDSERSRYLRKHGHGKPWRHPFVVKQVKPHAVLLEVPKDGSVPEVLPWQSLRKCSFAAPHFHDEEMPMPLVDDRGLVTTDRSGAPVSPLDDWTTWTASTQYDIEKILSARRVGSGWTLTVKWKGHPDTTSEPLSRILKDTNHPEILQEIARCKEEYFAQHPAERTDFTDNRPAKPDSNRPMPTRVQPSRRKEHTDTAMIAIVGVTDCALGTQEAIHGLRSLSHYSKLRAHTLRSFLPDFRGLAY